MKIYLHEITDQEKELDFTQEDKWINQAVLSVDEQSEDEPKKPKARSIEAHLSLRKVDDVIVVSGKIVTHIKLICSRCALPFQHPCHPSFSALFCKDPATAGVAHLYRQGTDPRAPGKPRGQNQGHARHAHRWEEDDLIAEGKDLDITYLSQDFIDLSDVIKEQLQLQVPFQPLCKDSCKGMCSQCGADLNRGQCACAKIRSTNPFSTLRDYKV